VRALSRARFVLARRRDGRPPERRRRNPDAGETHGGGASNAGATASEEGLPSGPGVRPDRRRRSPLLESCMRRCPTRRRGVANGRRAHLERRSRRRWFPASDVRLSRLRSVAGGAYRAESDDLFGCVVVLGIATEERKPPLCPLVHATALRASHDGAGAYTSGTESRPTRQGATRTPSSATTLPLTHSLTRRSGRHRGRA
jgi:hypothetical protein